MDDTQSRSGILVGFAAAVGAFGAAAMMSGAGAPTARADDFTDVINSIDGDYADGQAELTAADSDFSGNDLVGGLASLFSGLNDDSLSAPDNLLAGTVELLTNESVTGPISWGFSDPTSFSNALTFLGDDITAGETYFTDAATALSGGEYGPALFDDLVGADLFTVAPLEELILGAAVSF
jgi:hypothetical protein